MNEPINEPLGKPRGTVRAYLAIAIVTGFLIGHLGGAAILLGVPLIGLAEPNTEAALALLAALALETGTVSGFYFATRP